MAKIQQTTPVHDFVIPQGEDYTFQLKLYTGTDDTDKVVVDITNYKFKCVVREVAPDSAVLLEAECRIVDPANGLVDVHFKADDSDSLELDGSYYGDLAKYTYDVFETDAKGEEKRILCGHLYVSPSVSNR